MPWRWTSRHHGWWPGGGGIVRTAYWSPLTVTLLLPRLGQSPQVRCCPGLSTLLASLIPVFISMTAKLLVGRSDVALVAGWLSVFLPANLLYAGSLSSEVPSNLFAVLALWLLMKGIDPGSRLRESRVARFCEWPVARMLHLVKGL